MSAIVVFVAGSVRFVDSAGCKSFCSAIGLAKLSRPSPGEAFGDSWKLL